MPPKSPNNPPTPATLVIITGMSGAGKSKATQTLEDSGYFCVDNLPPSLLSKFIEAVHLDTIQAPLLAIATDIRSGRTALPELSHELAQLREQGVDFHLLFLEASDEALVRRFKENRRPHPLARGGKSTIECIQRERELLEGLRGQADIIIDTSDIAPRQLVTLLRERLGNTAASELSLYITSFGFKYGLPLDSDMVLDVRFLPNPYYEPALREQSGLDEDVVRYVLDPEVTKEFLRRYLRLMRFLLPHYQAEGKRSFVLAVGCTGGQHRSVVLAEELGRRLRRDGYSITVNHRDRDHWQTKPAAKEKE